MAKREQWLSVLQERPEHVTHPVHIAEGGKSYLVKMPRIKGGLLTNHGVPSVLPVNKIVITRLNAGRASFQLPIQFKSRVFRTNERHGNGSAFCFRVKPGLFLISIVPADPKIDPMQTPLPIRFDGVTAAPANRLPASSGIKVFHGLHPHAGQVRNMKVPAGPLRAFGR